MKMYVGITDKDWYSLLKSENSEEVNFWKPGGTTAFKSINPGELFLFKLHSPDNYIVGGGFFLSFSILPSSLAWDAFGTKNGTESLFQLRQRIYKYRNSNRTVEPDPTIGYVILTSVFYFDRANWIPVPSDWSGSIVQGKIYDTSTSTGYALYTQVQEKLKQMEFFRNELIHDENENPRYGSPQTIEPRLGQGSFRVLTTEAYHRRCAITGEKTLPVLDAAHIKPYSEQGPHKVSNGLLLRKDIHTLFDRGYITIDDKYNIEVSSRLKEDYGNGKVYYAYHGKRLLILPDSIDEMPSKEYLEWHNNNIFIGA
jgi:putative restriction endonuclease